MVGLNLADPSKSAFAALAKTLFPWIDKNMLYHCPSTEASTQIAGRTPAIGSGNFDAPASDRAIILMNCANSAESPFVRSHHQHPVSGRKRLRAFV